MGKGWSMIIRQHASTEFETYWRFHSNNIISIAIQTVSQISLVMFQLVALSFNVLRQPSDSFIRLLPPPILCRPLLIALFVFISSQPVHHHLPLNPDPGNLWRPHMLWHACHSTRKCQEIEGDRRGTVQALFGTLSSWQPTLPIRRTTAHERTTADGDDCHRGGWIVFTRLTRCCQFWSFPRRGRNWHVVRKKIPGWFFCSIF